MYEYFPNHPQIRFFHNECLSNLENVFFVCTGPTHLMCHCLGVIIWLSMAK